MQNSIIKILLQIIQFILSKFNYAITKSGFKKFFPGEYTLNLPNYYLIYTPWNLKNSKYKLYETTSTPDRLYIIDKFSRAAKDIPGDFAECGVYRGISAKLIVKNLGENKRLYLYDTFSGMPSGTNWERDSMRVGELSDTSESVVKLNLKGYLHNVVITKGIIPNCLDDNSDRKFSFLHLDVDSYSSTYDALKYFYPRISLGGYIICDDYGFLAFKNAAKKAIDDYMAEKIEPVISLGTSQCLIIKQ